MIFGFIFNCTVAVLGSVIIRVQIIEQAESKNTKSRFSLRLHYTIAFGVEKQEIYF
jgi:hypothetical protein